MWIGLIVWLGLHLVFFCLQLRYRDSLPVAWKDALYNYRGLVWLIAMLAMMAMLWVDSPVLWEGTFIDMQMYIDIYYVVWIIFGTLMFITPTRGKTDHEAKTGQGPGD